MNQTDLWNSCIALWLVPLHSAFTIQTAHQNVMHIHAHACIFNLQTMYIWNSNVKTSSSIAECFFLFCLHILFKGKTNVNYFPSNIFKGVLPTLTILWFCVLILLILLSQVKIRITETRSWFHFFKQITIKKKKYFVCFFLSFHKTLYKPRYIYFTTAYCSTV